MARLRVLLRKAATYCQKAVPRFGYSFFFFFNFVLGGASPLGQRYSGAAIVAVERTAHVQQVQSMLHLISRYTNEKCLHARMNKLWRGISQRGCQRRVCANAKPKAPLRYS